MSLVPDQFAGRLAGGSVMTPQQRVTRRRFLGATAATAGPMLTAGARRLDANADVPPSDFSSTDHFWYRPQPAGPYTDSQRDNNAFGFADGTILLSEDNGRTWPHSIASAGSFRADPAWCRTTSANVFWQTRRRRKMTQQGQVYVCQNCGNMVEVLRARTGTLTCCGQPMALAEENTTDAAQEKHVPVIERGHGEVKVKVGSVAHPMQEDHYIEWIEIVRGEQCTRQLLKPGAPPEAAFDCPGGQLAARAYCNLHGLWKSEG